MSCAVIFGGTGFIGVFFAKHLLNAGIADKVYLFDKEPISAKPFPYRVSLVQEESRICEIIGDVRHHIDWVPLESVVLVANFAAIHREPGHMDSEYFETNLLGAKNVCEWTEKVNCQNLVFTSSISPYGPSEEQKDESSLTVPVTAYGSSKLVAEKIHEVWLAQQPESRKLLIVRPGVVFGPGEGGNVSRLIKAVIGRYFFYMGNRATRKAGVYVKELCEAITWAMAWQTNKGQGITLFNMSMNPGPSIEEYVNSVCRVANVQRRIPSVPFGLLYCIANLIEIVARPFNIKHPFSPVRIKKLIRSNNIKPLWLEENGYSYRYSLDSALEDWKRSAPEEWR